MCSGQTWDRARRSGETSGWREKTTVHWSTVEYAHTQRTNGPVEALLPEATIEEGTITLHAKQRRRSRCNVCKKTLSERRGTLCEGLRQPIERMTMVVFLLASRCPGQAMVQAFGRDEWHLADWSD